ncbi:Setd4 [Symbiodinium natans]|uniref:Setd4 protein n=1 Tax=Symbiodinium natans TaxID=878477 RepID=A0A812U3K1_9DINO|nr:Setd4 [Symbiodinium natans]
MAAADDVLAIEWPTAADPRKEEKCRALQDLGFEPLADLESSVAIELRLQFEEGPKRELTRKSRDFLIDVMQVLVMTDLELCFWPPCTSEDEARWSLSQLAPCVRRRAVLAARRVLRPRFAAAAAACDLEGVAHAEAVKVDDTRSLALPSPQCHSALRVAQVPARGLGVVVMEEVGSGEELFAIAEDKLLNVYTALKSQHFGNLAEQLLRSGLHVEAVTMLFAIAEHRRCQASPTAESPWRAVLERAPMLTEDLLPITWPQEALESLGEQISKLVEETQLSLWALSREVSTALAAAKAGGPGEAASCLGGAVSFDDLLWARCLFDSRAVSLEIQADGPSIAGVQLPSRVVCLAPEVDLLNHSSTGVCAPPYFDNQRRSLIVELAAPARRGTEVCLSYGPLQSWELLFYYGFCPEANPHDRLIINVDLPDDEGMAEKEVVLQLHGIPTEVALRPGAAQVGEGWAALGVLPPQLLRCFRVLLGEIHALDVDAAPGEGSMLEVDLQCLDAIEDLLAGLLEPLLTPAPGEPPFWWPLYGHRVQAFRSSQRRLLEDNVADLRALRDRNTNTSTAAEAVLLATGLQLLAASRRYWYELAAFNSEFQGDLRTLRRVARSMPGPILKTPEPEPDD